MILRPGHVVLSIHVSPVDILRKVFGLEHFPGMGDILFLAIGEHSSFDTASVFSFW